MVATYYRCLEADCKVVFPKYSTLVLHYGGKHHDIKAPKKEDCEVTEIPEGYDLKEPASKTSTPQTTPDPPAGDRSDGPLYRSQDDVSVILRKILESYPGLKEATVNEIMDWERLKGTLHPIDVRQLLTTLAEVPKGAADIIPQKYSLALQKAAQEGQVAVASTLALWGGMTSRGRGALADGSFPGFGEMPGGDQGFNLMRLYYPDFNRFPGGGYPNWQYPEPSREPAELRKDPETEARIQAIEETMKGVSGSLEILTKKLVQDEEAKKEEALNKRLDDLQAMIVNIGSGGSKDDEQDPVITKLLEELKEMRSEVTQLRADQSQAQITALTKQVSDLAAELKNKDKTRVEDLEARLEEEKNKKPITGRTEMDVINGAVEKTADIVKDAGRGIQSILLSGHTKEEFNPDRVSSKDRKTAGERLVQQVENAAALTEAEDDYLRTTPVEG